MNFFRYVGTWALRYRKSDATRCAPNGCSDINFNMKIAAKKKTAGCNVRYPNS